ncbi:unnamed protein product, partial [Polarella glacialis]
VAFEHMALGRHHLAGHEVPESERASIAHRGATGPQIATVDTPLGLHVGDSLHSWSPNMTDGFQLGTILLSRRIHLNSEPECMIRLLFR